MSEPKWQEAEVEAYQLPNEDNTYAGTHMVANLKPATVYLAKVSSRNVYGYSNPSQAFKFATRGAGNLSPLLSNFVSSLLDHTLKLSIFKAL